MNSVGTNFGKFCKEHETRNGVRARRSRGRQAIAAPCSTALWIERRTLGGKFQETSAVGAAIAGNAA